MISDDHLCTLEYEHRPVGIKELDLVQSYLIDLSSRVLHNLQAIKRKKTLDQSSSITSNMDNKETFRPAFTDPPGTILAGIPISNLRLVNPDIAYGLSYYESCAKHISDTFKASKVYIVASRSLCANTDKLDRLVDAIGKDKVVGTRKGITPHTPWSEILQITKECRDAKVDCLVTLGAGSITDGCKLVVLVNIDTIRLENKHL